MKTLFLFKFIKRILIQFRLFRTNMNGDIIQNYISIINIYLLFIKKQQNLVMKLIVLLGLIAVTKT